MEHDYDEDDGERLPDRAAGSPPRGAWLFDPGWLFVLAGVALCAAWLILPAERELIDLRNQRRALEAEHVRMLGALRAHADFLEEFERREPALIEHLAAAQLNLVPAGHQPGLLATRTDASPSARIAESMAARYTAPAPERPINSRLEHLVLGPARLWVVAAAILSIFMGLIIGPGIPTTTAAAGEADEGEDDATYDGDLSWDDDDDDDSDGAGAGAFAGREAELGRWRSRWATAREAAAAAIAARRAGDGAAGRDDAPYGGESGIDPASATTGAGGAVDGEPMVSVVSGHGGWTALFDLGTTTDSEEGAPGRSPESAPGARASRRGGAAGHQTDAMLWDAVTVPPRDPDSAVDHRTDGAVIDTGDDAADDGDDEGDDEGDDDDGDEYVYVDEDGNEIPADEAGDDDDDLEEEEDDDDAEDDDDDLEEDEDDDGDEYVYVDEDGNEIPADEAEDDDDDLEEEEDDDAADDADDDDTADGTPPAARRGAGKSPRHR